MRVRGWLAATLGDGQWTSDEESDLACGRPLPSMLTTIESFASSVEFTVEAVRVALQGLERRLLIRLLWLGPSWDPCAALCLQLPKDVATWVAEVRSATVVTHPAAPRVGGPRCPRKRGTRCRT